MQNIKYIYLKTQEQHPFHLVDPSPWPIITSLILYYLPFTISKRLNRCLHHDLPETWQLAKNKRQVAYFWIAILLEVIDTILMPQNIKIFGILLLIVLAIILLSLLFNNFSVVFEYLVSLPFMLYLLCVMYHTYTLYYQIGAIILLLCIIFTIMYKDKTVLKCDGSSEPEPFNNNTLVSKVFKYLNFNITEQVLLKFKYFTELLSRWLITVFFISIFLWMALCILDLYKLVIVQSMVFLNLATLLFILRNIKLASKLDIRIYNILLKGELLCCQLKQLGIALARVGVVTGGAEGFRRQFPKTWDSLDTQGAKFVQEAGESARGKFKAPAVDLDKPKSSS